MTSHAHRRFGEFFWLLVRRDLQVRYAGSSLGALWNLVHPLMMIAIYMTIFSSLMSSRAGSGAAGLVDYGGLAYGVHLCAGLIPWMLFSEVLQRSTNALIDNGNFLEKVSFPPLTLFWSILFNAMLVQGSAYLAFLIILLLLGKTWPLAAVAGLLVMLLLGLTAMGLGLILAGLNVFFRDTAQILGVGLQLLFWFTPIVYYKEIFDKADGPAAAQLAGLIAFGKMLVLLNPFERFISATQSLFGILATGPTGLDWTIIVAAPIVSLGLGCLLFRRMLPDVRDCL